MKSLLRMLFNVLPRSMRDLIDQTRLMRYRKKRIAEWESKGKPLPPPHAVKQQFIEDTAVRFNCNILLETGTYQGDMMNAEKLFFRELYSIELGENLFRKCVKRFKNYNHVHLFNGDSATILPGLVKQLQEVSLFWLDGHFSGGITALAASRCPVRQELDAILSSPLNHVILIDDADDFIGANDYPSVDEIKDIVSRHKQKYSIHLERNIICIFPSE